MEDENADRVYVPGTDPTPPARDVEPFWPPEELESPVHGGRPVPHDAPPTRPLPPAKSVDPGVYRPVDRVVVPKPPAPEPSAPPVQLPRDPSTGDPPTQAWPNIPPRLLNDDGPPAARGPGLKPAQPLNGPAQPLNGPAQPASGAGVPISTSGTESVAADSPWAQPPQRPMPTPPDIDIRALGSRSRGTPPPASGPPASSPPAATPPPASENGDGGIVYRPEPRRADGSIPPPDSPPRAPGSPGQPTPAVPTAHTGPPAGSAPHPGPAPHPGSAPHPGPAPHGGPAAPARPAASAGPVPGTQPGAVPPGAVPQQPHPQQRPGPYPPTVGPRATQPHPHVNQQPPAPQGPPPQGRPAAQPQPPVDPYQQVPWISDGTPTAEEFARRRLAKPAEPTATMGARALLQKSTMGLVRLAPGKAEKEYKQDVEMVRRNFGGLRQVTVVNPKGGAGKTVAVLLLAMTFGQKRGGYVLAWDNNETQGTLGMRAQQDFHARTVRDMMRDLHLFRGAHGRVGDLSQYVRAQGEGMFDVLASDESATAGEMLTASAFAEIREIVSRFYKLIFVDTGNNVRAQNWQAAMDATDQLVITMSARNDSAETAARMLDHLEQSGRQRLVRQAVSVVTMPPTRKDIDLPAIQRHFAARTRAVLMAPYEKLIDSGEPIRYGSLSNNTRDAWLKIAASVAEGL